MLFQPHTPYPGEGDRVTYEYWLEHVSSAMGPDAQLKEALMINDLHARQDKDSNHD